MSSESEFLPIINKVMKNIVNGTEEYETIRKNFVTCIDNEKLRGYLKETDIVSDTTFNDPEYTLTMVLPREGVPYNRSDVLAALNESGLRSNEVFALGTMETNNKWMITVKYKESVAKLMGATPLVNGIHIGRVYGKSRGFVKIRIHWLPVYIPMTATVLYLSKYGLVKSCDYDISGIKSGEKLYTTVRNFIVELTPGKELPSLDNLKYGNESYRMLVTVPGRGPVCFKCNMIGHVKSQCTTVICRHCKAVNVHMSEDCGSKNSYATKVAANVSKDVTSIIDDPATDVAQQSVENVDTPQNVEDKAKVDNQLDNQVMESDSGTVVEESNVVAETQLVDSDNELVIDETSQNNRKRESSTSPARDKNKKDKKEDNTE